METNTDNINAVRQGLTGLLVKLGVGETVAQWIVNITVAVAVAALVTAGVLTITGCTVTASQGSDGAWSYGGQLTIPDGLINYVSYPELNADK